jgi:DNA-binding NtrC family response regulator
MDQHKILVIDDEYNNTLIIEEDLIEKGFRVYSSDNGEDGIKVFQKEDPDLVLLDVMMPGIDGIETLKRIKNIDKSRPVIMVSAHATINTAVEAMKIGARDFLVKPILLEQLSVRINEILESERLRKENIYLKEALKAKVENTGLYGESEPMKKVINKIEKIASTNINVLVLGESGTGKELVAKAIHNLSGRSNKPFIAINCGAIPKDLVESELFGHEKGAFTGAISKKMGKFQQAHGGTLFLDEIADLSFDSQVKLLRALQEQEVQPIGSNNKIKVDVRVISATNKNLEELIQEKKFREDLYFRLNVFPIYIPPLRDRKEDIEILAKYFIAEISNREGNLTKTFSKSAMEKLKSYYYKGNIRELQNIVERAYIMADEEVIDDVPGEIMTNSTTDNGKKHELSNINNLEELFIQDGDFLPLYEIEKIAIEKALEYYGYNLSNASRILKIGRDTLYRKIKNYGLEIKRN